jgi:hypothetical protein
MVSIKSLAVAVLAAAPIAMAKIDSVKVPAEATAGSNITATMQTSIYVQNYDEFGIVWGLQKPADATSNEAIGTKIGFTPLT